MSRPLRLEYPGALWHVTSRGNERKAVFNDDEDRTRFVEILGETVSWAGWRLHAYVLMGNHYHLLVETPEMTLSRGMRQLNGVYTQYFNHRHRRSGHLFQGRFKGILVEKDAHLTEMIRYIVLNPVRAKLCASAKAWRWSSYRATAGITKAPGWLQTEWTWQCFSRRSRAAGQAGFRAHVNGRRGEEYRPWQGLQRQIFLGNDEFINELKPLLEGKPERHEVPRTQREIALPGMKEIVRAIAARTGESAGSLAAKRGSPARALAAHAARSLGRHKLMEIAPWLGVKPWSVSHLERIGRRLVNDDAGWRRIWRGIVSDLMVRG
jgi:REP element-mobilizing transposase RayT